MNVNSVLNSSQVTNKSTKVNSQVDTKGTSFDTYLGNAVSEEKTVSLNELFQNAADTYGVPVSLLKAIGYAESSFRVDATSHCGAQGIMQLMPATAKSLGVMDAYDPEQNINGGAKYISQLLNKYDGNTTLALAAYNAGSGNVAKYGGIPPFKETQNYVVKVTNYMNQQLDADQKVTIGSGSFASNVNSVYTPVFEEFDAGDSSDLQEKWNEIFSYDNYEMFLKLLKEDEENRQEEEQQNSALSQISMNPSIANLLRSANLDLV